MSKIVKKGYRQWAGFVPSNSKGKPLIITGRKDEEVEKKRNAALGDEQEGVGFKDWAAVIMEIENYAKKLEEKKKSDYKKMGTDLDKLGHHVGDRIGGGVLPVDPATREHLQGNDLLPELNEDEPVQ
jgi:hypothetical protein